MSIKTITILAVTITYVFLTGCGNDNGDGNDAPEVGCEWFIGDNCWKSSLKAAKECLPSSDSSGTLSADGSNCTYENGTEIIFHNPFDSVSLDNDTYSWDFEVRSDSDTCLSYKEVDGQIYLTTSEGTFQEYNSALLAMTCPDGSKYTANGFKILGCEDAMNNLPGTSYSWQPDFIYFALLGTGEDSIQVFQCSR